jgi:hypothetical protein
MSAGTTLATSGTVSFANSNGVSFGMNGNTMTATVATNYQSQGAYLTTAMQSNAATISNINFSAGTTSANLSALTFSNSNGVSFGLNNGTVTATVATNYQSQGAYLTTAMQSNAATISNINFSAGTTSGNLSALTFSNANGVSFGLNAGTVTATVATNYQSQGAYLTTAMQSNAATISNINVSAGTTSGNLSAFTLANSNGLTFGLNAGTITGSYTVPTQTQYVFSNSNNISFGTNGSTVTATATFAQSNQNLSIYALGNTTQNSSTVLNANALSFNGLGNISVGFSNGSIQLSQTGGGGGGITNINVSAGTTSNNLSALTFSNSNGVSFGLNGSVVTATVATNYQSQGAYLTTAMVSNAGSNFVGLNTAITNGLMTANSSGISINLSNLLTTAMASNAGSNFVGLGSAITNGTMTFNSAGLSLNLSNHLTTAMASNAGSNFVGLNTAITNGLMTANSSGISINLSNHLTTAMASNAGSNFIGLNTAITNGLMTANSSGISINLSNLLTTAMASNAGSNFAGVGSAITNGTMTYGSNGLSLNLSNHLTTAMASNAGSNFVGLNSAVTGASLTVNSSGISINVPAAAPSPVYVVAGTTNGSLGTISFANSNGVSFGLNGSTITASAAGGGGGGIVLANTETTYTSGTANLIASGALTIGSTTGQSFYFSAPAQSSLSATGQVSISVNGSTISIGVPNAVTLSEYAPFMLGNNTTFSSAGQSTVYLQKIQPQQNFSFSAIERWASISFASSTNNASVNYSILYGIYSRDSGASSTRMTRMGSSQMDIRAGFSSNTSMAASIVVGANTFATASGGTGIYTNITAGRHIYFPYATSLSGGNEYWVAFNVLSASTGTSTPLRIALLELTNINNLTWGKIKSNSFFATAASFVDDFAQGVFTAQSAALPSTIADSQISNQVSLGRQYLNFDNN